MEQIGGVYYTIDADSGNLLALENQVNKSNKTMQREFDKTDKSVDALGRQLSGLQAPANAAAGAMNKLTPAAEGVQQATRNMSGAFGQLGYQVQDIVVQLQGGQSAFMVFAQQGSQIASAFGPAGAVYGAVIALAGAIGGALFSSITKTNEVASKLPESVKKWVEELKSQYVELDQSAKSDFAQAQIGKVQLAYSKVSDEVDALEARLKKLKTTGLLGENIDTTTSLPQQIAKTEQALVNAKKRAGEFTQMLNELNRVFTENLATKTVDETADSTQKATDRTKELAQQFEVALLKITQSEEAATRLYLAQELNLKAGEKLPPEVDKAVTAYYRAKEAADQLKESQKAITKAAEEELAAEVALYNEREKAAQKAAEEELAAENAKYNKLQGVVGAVQSELETPAQKAQRELSERLKVIQDYYGLENEEQAKRTAEGVAAETAYQKQLTTIAKNEADQRRMLNMSTLQAAGDFFGNLASIAEQGGKDQFQTYKNLASVQAAISATMAVLNVLANPMIPYPLNVGLAASMAGLAGAQVAKIQSMEYSGGRLYGGPVSPGNVYPITEDGRPEILQQGNKQYLLPGSRGGNVISNKAMTAGQGGSNVEVVVNNYSGEAVSVAKTQQGSGMTAKEVINIVVGNISQRGEIHRTITGTTTASNRT